MFPHVLRVYLKTEFSHNVCESMIFRLEMISKIEIHNIYIFYLYFKTQGIDRPAMHIIRIIRHNSITFFIKVRQVFPICISILFNYWAWKYCYDFRWLLRIEYQTHLSIFEFGGYFYIVIQFMQFNRILIKFNYPEYPYEKFKNTKVKKSVFTRYIIILLRKIKNLGVINTKLSP